MYNKYRAGLIAKGASTTEADRQMDIVERLMRERPDAYGAMFNNIYRTDNPVFSTQPNALLVATIEQRKPGRALDIGIGQGRNSVFLSLKGWDVTGFDASDEGIATAQRNATRAGVKINAVRETEAAFDYGADQWDLIVFTYEPFPITSAAYVERLGTALKPRGIIVIESLAQEEATPNRTPVSIDPGRLLAVFNTQQFRILRFEDMMAKSDWNAGNRRLVRRVAEKRQ
jgi:2-polyprenyl-3-methyl-5-hydroxy-6-metoxy-1,4-benzoquinol methylase